MEIIHKERTRFKRSCVASSRGSYVMHSHKEYLKENHNSSLSFFAAVKEHTPVYYVKCFGSLIQVTPERAAMYPKDMVVIKLFKIIATNRNEPWGECELLSSRKISEEEVEELRHKMFGTCSWEESIKDTINRLIQEGANIKNDNGILTMDMDTLLKIIEEYSYE